MFNIFNVAASAMQAQSRRLSVVASNIANAESASSSKEAGYRAKQVVFQSAVVDASSQSVGVKVTSVTEDQSPLRAQYQPNHPLADEKGYVYMPNVDTVSEMADMLSTTRSYQFNADVLNAAKSMAQKSLQIGTE